MHFKVLTTKLMSFLLSSSEYLYLQGILIYKNPKNTNIHD